MSSGDGAGSDIGGVADFSRFSTQYEILVVRQRIFAKQAFCRDTQKASDF